MAYCIWESNRLRNKMVAHLREHEPIDNMASYTRWLVSTSLGPANLLNLVRLPVSVNEILFMDVETKRLAVTY